MSDAIFLKSVEEGRGCILHFRFLQDDHTLKVGVHTARLQMGPYGNIGVVPWPFLGVIDPPKSLVEEVVETLMNIISLTHDDRVALDGRVADGSYRVDLRREQLLKPVISSEQTEGTFWSWLSPGKSLQTNIFVFFLSRTPNEKRSRTSESSSEGSMISLYRTSFSEMSFDPS